MVNFSYEYLYSFTAWRDFSFNAQNCRQRDGAMTMTRQCIKDDTTEDPIIIVTALSLSHDRSIAIIPQLSHYPYRTTSTRYCFAVPSHHCHCIILIALSHHRFIVLALSHHRRKRRWCDDAILNNMAYPDSITKGCYNIF